ncbi:F5/8 type C domain-containing protein [Mariniphaga anaerophila]|uniref:F5/8 type C domain-containing protein n=1 Tax=Mariniphaga anaerophila TaxID=1484053 RepID=A0A1M5E8K1_9BACT|nr:family 43 glycosylhydrolase [Mariniphaga anaerophila]SHF75520.1 F5/8 type C domain-containing protein [Mariniphaga anaerophila]
MIQSGNRIFLAAFFLLILSKAASSQEYIPPTYCNPLNIDYTYMVYNSDKDWSYRSGADPAVVEFRGEYYMFVTRSFGYWHSTDLLNWKFITPEKWYFQGSNAPAAFNYKDSVLYVAGDPSGSMSILYTENPKKGDWKAAPSIINNLQDPALFIDDDGQAYMYWGSSNTYPLRVRKLNKNKRFVDTGEHFELFNLNEEEHGWERFGEDNFHPTLKEGYMEGAWMTKHNGKYYLQYAAPGTEFNVYADGVYISDHPLGPFEYMPNNPISFKPGGFMNGAGHGSTVLANDGQYWHFASMALSSNVKWERRLCMYPTYFDNDGLMHSNTHYGDYPRFAPGVPGKAGQPTGWVLLSYKKPVTVSSSLLQQRSVSTGDKPVVENFPVEKNENGEITSGVLSDEDAKSFWVAEANDTNQWVTIDLENIYNIYSFQINYHDYKSDIYSREDGLYHRYTIEISLDGINWKMVTDKSKNFSDVPNDYVQLNTPEKARYFRYNHIHSPTPFFALSDLRIFGLGDGKKAERVKKFKVERQDDRRDALISWQKSADAFGYNIRWGIAPDKLYNSWLIYNNDSLLMRSLDKNTTYYFTIEAFNENGISEKTNPIKVK